MKRRSFVAWIGGAAATWPLAPRAQRATPVLGFLNSATPETYTFNARAFRDGLAEAGYAEGRNLAVEYRWAHGDYARLPALAAELVARKVDVIAATGDVASARAAQAATTTIPIVFTVGADPVRFGLVKSMAKPGGNATGITLVTGALSAKRLEILREIVPQATLIGLFMNPDTDRLRVRHHVDVRGGRRLRGQDPRRRESRRATGGPAVEVRPDRQPEDGARDGARDPRLGPAARRRDHRVGARVAARLPFAAGALGCNAFNDASSSSRSQSRKDASGGHSRRLGG